MILGEGVVFLMVILLVMGLIVLSVAALLVMVFMVGRGRRGNYTQVKEKKQKNTRKEN
jgi:heme/copper-type cytochrome/quinol oxidase subunit 2